MNPGDILQFRQPTMQDSRHLVPNLPRNAPCIPSGIEREHYYHSIPSKPLLIACSSDDPWVPPMGPHPYLAPKGCSPIGQHCLNKIWEDNIIPAMDEYLMQEGVQYTSLDPVCIGTADEPSPPVIVWIGVIPGSLSAEKGIEVAAYCRSILTNHGINDIHIEIHESQVTHSAKMYQPIPTSHPIVQAVKPFSTALGFPICNAVTPYLEGTAGLFFTNPCFPQKLYLLTARHVLLHPDVESNEFYQYCEGSGQPCKKVLLLGKACFMAHLTAIMSLITDQWDIIKLYNQWLEGAAKITDKKHAEREQAQVQFLLGEANVAIKELQKFLTGITREWEDVEKWVIGHIVLSPAIKVNFGDDSFTQDWAVVEIYPTMIDRSNFVVNIIDLGTSIDVNMLTCYLYPHPSNPTLFKYPPDQLLKFYGTISDKEMYRPDPKTKDQDNDPVIMVLKHGITTNLTVGCLSTICSVTQTYFKGKPSEMSTEVAVWPCTLKSGPFSESGVSGSAVVSGTSQVAGIITGGAGCTDASDCTYVTSINFILKSLETYGIKANIFPTATNL